MLREVSIHFEGCSKDSMYFSFLLFSYIILLYTGLVTIIYDIHCSLFSYIYDDVCCFSPISPYVVSLLSLYTCFFMYTIFISVSH